MPIIAVVIGEPAPAARPRSALGIAVLMLQYSIYSVISARAARGILWKSAERPSRGRSAGITAEACIGSSIVDEVIPEPLGGAHRDAQTMADTLKHAVAQTLATLQAIPLDSLLVQRRKRLAGYGVFKEG